MYRAVVADDDPLIRMDIKEIIELNGYAVVGEAADGFDAVELCRAHRPDFVIMDIRMPLLDGIKASEIINNEKLARCVILITESSDKAYESLVEKSNVMAYLVKPINADALIPAIEIALCRCNDFEQIKRELEKTKQALEDRKILDRAKGILMDTRGISEMAAYTYLRKVAMNKECTVAQVAKMIVLSGK